MKIEEYLTKVFENEEIFELIHYELVYEIHPEILLFTSEQQIAIKNISSKSIVEIEGLLLGRLSIDSIIIKDPTDDTVLNQKWVTTQFEDQYIRREGFEGIQYQRIAIQMDEPIQPGQEFLIWLKFHMPPKVIKKSEPAYMWSFVVNPQVSYAVEPRSGHYLWVLYGEPSAPFDLTITYPVGNHSCVPGLLDSTKQEKGFIIDHYKSKYPNIPAFAVAPYQEYSRAENGFGIEFYIYPGQSLDEDLFDYLFKIVQLFCKTFGDNGTNTYRFGAVGAYDSTIGGGENKGNAIYFDAQFLNEYDQSLEARTNIAAFCAHEIFHNWNLFFVHFVGDLYEWFGEGGANFIAAWALEKVANKAAGALVRRNFVQNYIKNEGFNAKNSLLNVDKRGGYKENLALMYDYGALVWEQLRQKMGERRLFAGLKRFFRQYGHKNTSSKELFECLQKEASIKIKDYVGPWINQIPRMDISITTVDSKRIGSRFITDIKIEIQSERDFELITEVGYRTSVAGELIIVPVTFTKNGSHIISFESDQKPVFVHVDPFYRVPQTNIENCSWFSEEARQHKKRDRTST
jgi:hypothetical protein